MNIQKLKSKGVVFLLALFIVTGPLSVQATEYKPLVIDLPVDSFVETGTTAYVIKKGDTLFGIGRQFNSEAGLIAALNNIKNPNFIKPGQKILVPRMLEITHEVTAGDTILSIASIYGILPQQILLANDIWFPNKLIRGTVLSIPGVTAQVTITNNTANKVSSRHSGNFMYSPTTGVLTSLFGLRNDEYHTGIDLANKQGTPIMAAQSGRVAFVGRKGNYGQTVIIEHGNKFKTLYGHASKILVREGQWVQAREIIALMGNTGRSTGTHLHFEIYEDGKVVDPLKYVYIAGSEY